MDGNETPDAGTLRFLKTLVTVLTLTMIIGLVTIVSLFVMRFSEARGITFPDEIALPEGAVPVAFTQADAWYAVVTDANEILIYSRLSGALIQRIDVVSE